MRSVKRYRMILVLIMNAASVLLSSAVFADNDMAKVLIAGRLEDEARSLAEAGQYDMAIHKYKEAIDPKYWDYEWETSTARFAIASILTLQNKYLEALDSLEWHLRMNSEKYQDYKEELIALDAYMQTGETEAVYTVIEKLKNKYPNFLPPNGLSATDLASRIIRLYETIGDLDRGEAYARACVFYFYKNAAEHGSVMEAGLTAKQAFLKGQERNRIADAYAILADLLTVYEGFQKDREQGFSGCAKTPPGEVCMGNATKAIIQSKFYPW